MIFSSFSVRVDCPITLPPCIKQSAFLPAAIPHMQIERLQQHTIVYILKMIETSPAIELRLPPDLPTITFYS